MNPRIKSVTPMEEYILHLRFTNGETGRFDCSVYLNIGVFKELRDVNYFRRVRVFNGTIVWPNEQDFCPDTLYEESEKIT